MNLRIQYLIIIAVVCAGVASAQPVPINGKIIATQPKSFAGDKNIIALAKQKSYLPVNAPNSLDTTVAPSPTVTSVTPAQYSTSADRLSNASAIFSAPMNPY